jgi:hypothetical protein
MMRRGIIKMSFDMKIFQYLPLFLIFVVVFCAAIIGYNYYTNNKFCSDAGYQGFCGDKMEPGYRCCVKEEPNNGFVTLTKVAVAEK